MKKTTKDKFEKRVLFLQKLFYEGYISEAERDILKYFGGTTIEGRCVFVETNCKKQHQIIVDDDFIVFENEYEELVCKLCNEVK